MRQHVVYIHDLCMTLTFDLYVGSGGILSEFYSQFTSCWPLSGAFVFLNYILLNIYFRHCKLFATPFTANTVVIVCINDAVSDIHVIVVHVTVFSVDCRFANDLT